MEDAPKTGTDNAKENRLIGIGWDGNGFEEERKVNIFYLNIKKNLIILNICI